jgi:hypothetical protein
MKRASRQQSEIYEVRCPACAVSFPVGTRRCIHCGGATAVPQTAARLAALRELPFEFEPADGPPMEEEPEQKSPRRGGRGLALMWLLLAVAASIYRTCAQGGTG